MKKPLLLVVLGLLLGSAVLWWRMHRATGKVPAEPTPVTTASTDLRRPDVRLTVEEFMAAGLASELPKSMRLPLQQTGFARVLDPTSLITLIAEVEAAEASAEASGRELARVRQLNANGDNASTRTVEAAEATARRDQVQVTSARARLRVGWGSALSEKSKLASLLAELSQGAAVLVRVDLPGNPLALPPAAELQLESLTGSATAQKASVLGAAPQADPQFQGVGYLAVLRAPVPVGTLLRAKVPTGAEVTALVVPASAILRHEGRTVVYVEMPERAYERRIVSLEQSVSGLAAVASGLSPGERVVTAGAQQLLSHELLKAQEGP